MTNAQIIMQARLDLAEAGVLKTDENGMPEVIHTYKGWQDLGFQVQKGSTHKAKFKIWKHNPARTKKDGTEVPEKMNFVWATWFTFDQVKPIAATKN